VNVLAVFADGLAVRVSQPATGPRPGVAAVPMLPLALNAEVCLPVDLEATYTDACRRRRLA
jgi:hypothetical protein